MPPEIQVRNKSEWVWVVFVAVTGELTVGESEMEEREVQPLGIQRYRGGTF
jgi:hypothetical protein